MTMTLDTLETRPPAQREAEQFARLRSVVAHARRHAPHFARLLAHVDPEAVTDRTALGRLPVTRKSDLLEWQQAEPPFGGLAATPLASLARVFSSPGPIYDPQAEGADPWRFGRALRAAGFRAGELVHNTFSYHFTPAGFMMDLAARSLGCPVFPAGTGQTELQVQAVAGLRPACYAGTPSFLRILLEKADEMRADVSCLKRAAVSGEAFLAPVRQLLAERGIEGYQSYGTADLGLVAYETSAREGLVVDEDVIVEIVRPGTGDPVPEGEVGEVVVSALSPDYPLVRFATGDLSALMAGPSPCGRTGPRMRGWMGRADQTTKVKGMFVHPSQVAEVLRRHPEAGRGRLVVSHDESGHDLMTLHVEASTRPDNLAESLAASLREVCKLRGAVALAEPGSLANDGRVIEDRRRFD